MNKSIGTLIIVWNVALTALLGWALMRSPSTTTATATTPTGDSAIVVAAPVLRDTSALKEARIAFFNMDSLQANYELVKEREASFLSEGRRLESVLAEKMTRAQARYGELMAKDQTYSTKAQLEADEAELKKLSDEIQQLRSNSQERLDKMQSTMLQEITDETRTYLKEFNSSAGFDYILSIQDGGQIWVGNEGLSVTQQLLDGLNARHRARKAAKK